MTFFVTLYIWTVVAATPSTNLSHGRILQDWRAAGEFRSIDACEKGAKALGLELSSYRCVRKDGA